MRKFFMVLGITFFGIPAWFLMFFSWLFVGIFIDDEYVFPIMGETAGSLFMIVVGMLYWAVLYFTVTALIKTDGRKYDV